MKNNNYNIKYKFYRKYWKNTVIICMIYLCLIAWLTRKNLNKIFFFQKKKHKSIIHKLKFIKLKKKLNKYAKKVNKFSSKIIK